MSNQPAVIGPDGIARPYIGGQALIEGVMMRSPHAFAAVVRRRDGTLLVREEPMQDLRRGSRALPLVRGVIALVEALKLGSRALRFSAEIYEKDLDDGDGPSSKPSKPSKPSLLALLSLPIIALLTNDPGLPASPRDNGKQSGAMTWLSVLFAIGLFVVLPQASAEGISRVFHLGLEVRSAGFQLLTGGAKLFIVIGYMLAIRRIPEIYRVFQYHGAEHKSIYAYESGKHLVLADARPQTTLHPRCGTTFIVMVALVSILAFTAIGPFLPNLGLGRLGDNVLFLLVKLPFLPLIAAVTFELQRLLARFAQKGPLRVLLWPGFLVQKITTIEPDDAQLEVALAALSVTAKRERAPDASLGGERVFADFGAVVAG
ncbi:MAG TPA: DUF1385 domain-containing protein [Polyangiaceae bacterium]|jgi:uncharacterized protein YqhQ|nr:DUF1385 domain-containing protein [Polyangiaceae bacterium]